MRHIFSVNVAKKYGMDCAVMLENLYFWISKNKANDKHYHDGKYWTYNSVKAFEELFPYWTYNQVRRILKKLEDEELIEKGNFNQSTYDRTAWYTLTTNAFAFFDSSMCVKPQMEDDKSTNRNGENNKPIPDVNTDDKPDGKPITPIPPQGADGDLPKTDGTEQKPKDRLIASGADKQVLKDFLEVRKAKRLPLTHTAIDGLEREARKASLEIKDAIRICAERGWGGFNANWYTGSASRSGNQSPIQDFNAQDYGKPIIPEKFRRG